MKSYDVVIIGAGTAGLSAQKEVSSLTNDYLVVDSGPLGTTCARVGCMPSKVFIEAANVFHQRTKFPEIGAISPAASPEVSQLDGRKLLQHVRKLRDHYVSGVKSEMESWAKSHFRRASARFVSKNVLDLDGERVTARKIIVATGSKPLIPPEWKNVDHLLLTTDSFFELENLPKKMAVMGFGAIGLELSQALARVGVDVTVFAKGATTGGLSDPEVIDYARGLLSEELRIYDERVLNTLPGSEGLLIKTTARTVEVECALVAVGRLPNINGMNLENLGIRFDSRGLPCFDEQTFRIEDTDIYLVGDVNATRPILHEAAHQGRIAGYNSLLKVDSDFKAGPRFTITFSSPQIAVIGESYQTLVERKADFVEGHVSFEHQGRAVAKMENRGLLKIYGEKRSGKILGAELMAPQGEHLAHLLAWAIDSEWSVYEALRRPFYHPVLEEGLRTALKRLAKNVETPLTPAEMVKCEDPPSGF